MSFGKQYFKQSSRVVGSKALLAAAAMAGLAGATTHAAVKTWTGTTSANWATGTNWGGVGGTVPATGDSLTFTSSTGAGGMALSDNLMTPGTYSIAGITYNAGAAAFVIAPATSGTNGFTLTAGVTNSGTNLETINDAIAMTAVRAFTTIAGGGNIALGGLISGTAGGVSAAGSGTTTINGSVSNTYTGSTGVAGGNLTLDYANMATAANLVSSSSAASLGGGIMTLNGKASGTTSQTFNGLSLTTNTSSSLVLTNNGTALNVALGGLTRNAQSNADITFASTGTLTSSTTSATNTVATSSAGTAYLTAGGSSWVTNSAGTLGALTSYATGNANYLASNNVDVQNGNSVSGVTVGTLRFNAASDALTLAGVNTITTGGILVTSAGTASSITGGTLQAGSGGKELVIIDNGLLNIGSIIQNNTSASALTIGGSGTTTLSGANTYTGNTSINSGTTKLGIAQNGVVSGALGTGVGTTTVGSGAILNLDTYNVTVGALTGTGTVTSTATAGTGGVLTLTGTTNFSTALTGTMGLAFSRAGTGFGDTLQLQGSTYGYSGGLTLTSTTAGFVTAANLVAAGGVAGTSNLTVRFNTLAAVGTGTITLNNGGIHDTVTGTYANNITVGTNGGLLHIDGAGGSTFTGSLTGSGFLLLSNGFIGADTFTGSNAAFLGTAGIDTNNVGSVNLSGSATGNSGMSLVFGGNVANTTGFVQWSGTGSPTVQFGEVSTASGSTTTSGLRGSTTAGTTVNYQIGDNTVNTPVFAGIIANGSGNATTSVTAVTKVGTDVQTFSGASTYTGATNVNNGTLLINNTAGSGTGTGAVNITAAADNTTATLGGTGTINGAVTIAAPTGTGRVNQITGATSGTVGTLSLGGTVAFGAGSTYAVDIGAGANNADKLAITGAATVASGAKVAFNQLSTLDQGSYLLATAASGLNGNAFTATTPTGYRLAQSATAVNLISKAGIGTVTATPAAATILTGTSTTISGTIQNTAFSGGDNLNYLVNGVASGTANAGSTGTYNGVNYIGNTAGNNTVALSVTGNNASTGETLSGSGSTTVKVLDAADASFTSSPETKSLLVNIGSFSQGDGGGTESSAFNIYNLVQTAGFTADLQLASISLTTPDDPNLNTNLSTFANLSAGAFNAYVASLSTANVGTFSESYNLVFNSRDGANAFADSQTLSLTLDGTVNAVPEPATLGTIAVASIGLLRRRRR